MYLYKLKKIQPRCRNHPRIIDKWSDNKKTFRLINRTTLKHDKYPLKVDLSIVRSSKKIDRNYVPEYRFTNSGVLESSMEYEIEIELDPEKIGYGPNIIHLIK